MMRKIMITLAAIVPLAGCDLDIPDLNNPDENDLREDPSPEFVRAAATGLLIGHREVYAETSGYISQLGVVGRESYNFDAGDPRYRTEMLSPTLDGGSRVFGGNFWEDPYANIHVANVLLGALDDITDDFSDQEIDAIEGFIHTIKALDYLLVINTRDENGAAIVTGSTVDELPPLVDKEAVFDHIEDLLDDGHAKLLEASDTAFPFPLGSGFTLFENTTPELSKVFNTPATFILFNRAIAARVAVYRGKYQDALDLLSESFLADNPANPQLDLGVYNPYGTGSGDTQNELVASFLYAHPSVAADAVEGDRRVAQKTQPVKPDTENDLTADRVFTIYSSTSTPVPIIRNEELILLRAEANFELGNLDAAIADINFLREHSAGLAPSTELTEENFFDELVYQRRYGLLFEGHRWIDMRRWGLLEELPLDRPGDGVATAFPIPSNELNARQ